MPIKISASTNPPQLCDLNDYISKLDKEDIDFIHCDVMDGKFVKAKTFGSKKVRELKTLTSKPLDVHLMVKNPGRKIKGYAKAGANVITIHYESVRNKKKLIPMLQKIKKYGCFAGISFNPSTSVLEILPYIYFCDMLLVMSVVPGKSGQEFMPETYLRLDTINKFLKKQKMEVVVEVDGGVNEKNIASLIEKKVDSVVMGNYLYKAENLTQAIKKASQSETVEPTKNLTKAPEKTKKAKTTKTKKEVKPKKESKAKKVKTSSKPKKVKETKVKKEAKKSRKVKKAEKNIPKFFGE